MTEKGSFILNGNTRVLVEIKINKINIKNQKINLTKKPLSRKKKSINLNLIK